MSSHSSQKPPPGMLKGSKEGPTSKPVSAATVEFLLDKHPCPLDEGNLLSIWLQDGTKRRALYTAGGIKRECVQSYIQAEN